MAYGEMNMTAQSVPPTDQTALDGLHSLLMDCHDRAQATFDALERALGQSPNAESKPTPVPNGKIEVIRDSLHSLRGMLDGIASRANRLA